MSKTEEQKQRLIDIKNMSNPRARDKAYRERDKAYIELEAELGASGCGGGTILPKEREAEHIRSINQALQTAAMIDMCKTAARNFWIAIVAAIAAVVSAVAAWAAIVKMVK